MDAGHIFLIFILIALIICLIISYDSIKTLKSQVEKLEWENNRLERLNFILRNRVPSAPSREIPKGTIQAVKEAMKRAHPDNGGNTEDFEIYRRAYNVLTGKEKLYR